MNIGKSVFAQIMDFVPAYEFRKCVARYRGHFKVKQFTCWEHFLSLAFAQLTYRESLRDIEACLRSTHDKLYHLGFRSAISRNTLANANQKRNWRIYRDFAQILMIQAQKLYANDEFSLRLSNTVYALDSTTIDLCVSLFPWAACCEKQAAIKLHTLLNLRGNIPSVIIISDSSLSELKMLDQLLVDPGAFYVMDRGYFDFLRLYAIHQGAAYFVTRARSNFRYTSLYSQKVDTATGIQCDEIINVFGPRAINRFPVQMRRIIYKDSESKKLLVFLTNNMHVPSKTIADLYKCRWQIELFFKWIKQHLRIKAFYGTSENAVKTQIWIAVAVYVLIAIIKKQLKLEHSIYSVLQVLSVSLLEKTHIVDLFSKSKMNCFDNLSQPLLFCDQTLGQ